MRCLLVSDLHYVLKQFDWVLGAAAEFDVVIISATPSSNALWSRLLVVKQR